MAPFGTSISLLYKSEKHERKNFSFKDLPIYLVAGLENRLHGDHKVCRTSIMSCYCLFQVDENRLAMFATNKS